MRVDCKIGLAAALNPELRGLGEPFGSAEVTALYKGRKLDAPRKLALTHRMRTAVVFCLLLGAAWVGPGCNPPKPDVLRAFPEPHAAQRSESLGSHYRLDIEPESFVQVATGVKGLRGETLRYSVRADTLRWDSGPLFPVSGSLQLAPFSSETTPPPTTDRSPGVRLRVLTQHSTLKPYLKPENPESQAAELTLVGELEVAGRRSELELRLSVQLSRAASAPNAERRGVAQCHPQNRLEPQRYGLTLTGTGPLTKALPSYPIGCNLRFRLTQENQP